MRPFITIVTIIAALCSVQALSLAQAPGSYEKRDANIEQRSLPESHKELFRKRLFLGAILKVGKAIGKAIYNRKHNKHRRSLSADELFEERDGLLELRDHINDVQHRTSSYLAKRSDYEAELDSREFPGLSQDVVKRMVNQKRGVDYLLQLNARELAERDVVVSLDELD